MAKPETGSIGINYGVTCVSGIDVYDLIDGRDGDGVPPLVPAVDMEGTSISLSRSLLSVALTKPTARL